MKAPHGLDIPMVFDNVALAPQMTGDGPGGHAVAERMSETFPAFARTGDPNNRHIPRWPTYDLARRSTMLFDEVTRVGEDPRGDERRMFEKVPYVQPGT